MQLLSLVFQILCSTAAAKKISVDRNEKSFCGWITQKKCIFHGGQLRYQAQDNLIGLLACYLANKVCAAAVDRKHIALETMILFKIIAKDSLRTKVRCDINIHGARYF